MKRLLILVAMLLITLIPVGIWWFSDKQVIQRRTEHLMEVMTISSDSAGPIRQAKVFSMNALMAERITLSSPDVPDANGNFEKQELESAFSWICQNAKRAEMKIADFKKVEVNGDAADVSVLVDGFIEMPSAALVTGRYLIIITWQKTGDGWRYNNVTVHKQ